MNINTTACRVTVDGFRYEVSKNGTVRPVVRVDNKIVGYGEPMAPEAAKAVRHEAARQRRNRNARERNAAMRDLGMVKTPYGWE